ncbi:hypothetical protein AKJ42_03630 [candidate division MSBL1 archaeon SCGC-AAA261C02]|nr:hypothetical protein AKJ42_03630 [candidate division MSBL1 archaeon SCGC-AAA261C02]
MNRKILMSILVLILATGFTVTILPTAATREDSPQYVFLVTIDGCRPDVLQSASTPNIDNLLENSAYSWQAQTVYPSVTPVGHASLFTGATPETHGWSRYNYGYDVPLEAETVFQVFEEAGYETAIVDGKGGERIGGTEVDVTYVKNNVDYRWEIRIYLTTHMIQGQKISSLTLG